MVPSWLRFAQETGERCSNQEASCRKNKQKKSSTQKAPTVRVPTTGGARRLHRKNSSPKKKKISDDSSIASPQAAKGEYRFKMRVGIIERPAMPFSTPPQSVEKVRVSMPSSNPIRKMEAETTMLLTRRYSAVPRAQDFRPDRRIR